MRVHMVHLALMCTVGTTRIIVDYCQRSVETNTSLEQWTERPFVYFAELYPQNYTKYYTSVAYILSVLLDVHSSTL